MTATIHDLEGEVLANWTATCNELALADLEKLMRDLRIQASQGPHYFAPQPELKLPDPVPIRTSFDFYGIRVIASEYIPAGSAIMVTDAGLAAACPSVFIGTAPPPPKPHWSIRLRNRLLDGSKRFFEWLQE